MKKYKSIAKAVLLSCTLALTTSCNDFLDKAPDDQLTMYGAQNEAYKTIY